MKQSDVAMQLGISVRQYENIEHGDSSLSVTRLYELARIFKVTIHQILDFNPQQVFNSNNLHGNYIAYNYASKEQVLDLINRLIKAEVEIANLKKSAP